jgi:uncharacterized protein
MQKKLSFSSLGQIFAFLLLAFLFACASSSKVPQNSDAWPTRVIDAHTHVHFSGGDDSETERAKDFASANVVGAIAHTSHEKREDRDWKKLKTIACFGVSKNPDLKVLEKAIRSEGYRCFKIYLGYEHQAANHRNYLKVYALAKKLNAVVVFHTGDTLDANGMVKYADPLAIDEIAVLYRDVKFVIAHIGNPWIESAAEVAYKNKNVFVDASALLIGDLTKYPDEQLEEYVVKPIRWAWGYIEDPTKMMYGSDWPLVKTREYIRIVKRAIPKEHWDRFFYQNAIDVFGDPARL